ncbi:hypothetical protein GCM10009577_52130 [Streptomyces javensis]
MTCPLFPWLATLFSLATPWLPRAPHGLLHDPRNEHLAFEVWFADVRLDGPHELRALGRGMRPDWATILSTLDTTHTSWAVESSVMRMNLLKRQMYSRANFDLLRRRILHSP